MKEIEKFDELTQLEQEAAMGVAKHMMARIIHQQGFPEPGERVDGIAFTQGEHAGAAFAHGARITFQFHEADKDGMFLGLTGVAVFDTEAEFEAAIAAEEARGHQGKIEGADIAIDHGPGAVPHFGPVGEA